MKVLPGLLIAWISALFLCGCGEDPVAPLTRFDSMGTTAEVGSSVQEPQAFSMIAGAVMKSAAEMEGLFTLYTDESEAAKINRVAPTASLPVARHTHRLLQYALQYCEKTDGAFDITSAPIAHLWGFHGGVIPDAPLSKSVRQAALEGVGYTKVELGARSVSFLSPFTQVDLNGIAMGYTIDINIITQRKYGVKDLYFRIGSSFRCLGYQAPGQAWALDLPAPRDDEGSIGRLQLMPGQGGAFARAFSETVRIGDRDYSHVIDPRTGRTVEKTSMAVVLGPTATEADVLSTALLVIGRDGLDDIMPQFPRCEVLLIEPGDESVAYATPGIASQFKPADGLTLQPLKLNRGEISQEPQS